MARENIILYYECIMTVMNETKVVAHSSMKRSDLKTYLLWYCTM